MSFEEQMDKTVAEAVAKSLTIAKAEELAFARHEGRVVDVTFLSTYLNVSKDTIRDAARDHKIKHLPRYGAQHYKFDMQYALGLRKKDLK